MRLLREIIIKDYPTRIKIAESRRAVYHKKGGKRPIPKRYKGKGYSIDKEGFVIKDGDGAVARVLTGQTNQIEVLNADGKGGNPLIRIANNPVLFGMPAPPFFLPKADPGPR